MDNKTWNKGVKVVEYGVVVILLLVLLALCVWVFIDPARFFTTW